MKNTLKAFLGLTLVGLVQGAFMALLMMVVGADMPTALMATAVLVAPWSEEIVRANVGAKFSWSLAIFEGVGTGLIALPIKLAMHVGFFPACYRRWGLKGAISAHFINNALAVGIASFIPLQWMLISFAVHFLVLCAGTWILRRRKEVVAWGL